MSNDRAECESGTQHNLPDVGTKAVKHRQFSEPLVGEVVPTNTWSHPNELTPDSFVVEFENRTSRYTVDRVSSTGKVVHID